GHRSNPGRRRLRLRRPLQCGTPRYQDQDRCRQGFLSPGLWSDQNPRSQGSCGEWTLSRDQGPQRHEIRHECPWREQYIDLEHLLKSVGLSYSDVETVDLPLPDHVAALRNKSVDASASVEPAPTLAIKNRDAVLIKSDDEILPNHQIAVLLYSEDFALRQKEIATRFMRAYIRAVRFYNDALKEGRLQGTTADEVIAILSEATPIKNRDVYKS